MKKKQYIIDTATRLFAEQGFQATTTLQITREAGVTEPLLYYHFSGKDELFTHILENAFTEYYNRLQVLKQKTDTEFEKIQKLIELTFDIVDQRPHEIYLVASACPARLKDPKHICSKSIKKRRKWMTTFLSECLKNGIDAGEFYKVPIEDTVSFLIATIIGLLRQRGLRFDGAKGLKEAAVEFCRRSLVKK